MHPSLLERFEDRFKFLVHARIILAAVWLVMSVPAHAEETYSNVNQNIQASMSLGNRLKDLMEPTSAFPVKVVSAMRTSNSPFQAIVTAQGSCILVVNEKPSSWLGWANFAGKGQLKKTDSFYFAMLHELGHCLNKLSPLLSSSALPEGVESELFADVFALVAGSILFNRDTYHQVAQGVIKARLAQERWFSGSSHATGKKLEIAYGLIDLQPEVTVNAENLAQHSREIFEKISGQRYRETALISLPESTIN